MFFQFKSFFLLYRSNLEAEHIAMQAGKLSSTRKRFYGNVSTQEKKHLLQSYLDFDIVWKLHAVHQ